MNGRDEEDQYIVVRTSAGLPRDHKHAGEMDLYNEQLYLPAVGVPGRLGRVVNTAGPLKRGADLPLGDRALQAFATGPGFHDRTLPRLRGVAIDNKALLDARKKMADDNLHLLSRSHAVVATPTELYPLCQAFPSVCDNDVDVLAATEAGRMTEAKWLVSMHACPRVHMCVMEGSLADSPTSVLSRKLDISELAEGSLQTRRHLERAKVGLEETEEKEKKRKKKKK